MGWVPPRGCSSICSSMQQADVVGYDICVLRDANGGVLDMPSLMHTVDLFVLWEVRMLGEDSRMEG